jgi:hypothetical protein
MRQIAATPKAHRVVHGGKNGVLSSTEEVLHAPKGQFKVDRESNETAVGDESQPRDAENGFDDKRLALNVESPDKPVGRIDGPDVQPAMPEMRIETPEEGNGRFLMLLAIGIPAILAGLLIWRFRAGKKNNNGNNEEGN